MSNWPLVDPRDDGIRPAGGPNECFYCGKKIGEPHARDCVIVTRRVLVRIESADGTISGMWEKDSPYSFDPEMIEYMYNDGTWCANNILDYDVAWDQPGAYEKLKEIAQRDDECLCGMLGFKFVRVVDDTPRRALKS